ncbi:hypothetical protein Arcpr_0255 [Archaeoglobus profundus DSM 5631]|uniref:Uncharacterized protein n=1 Tax=Archaeoglobus profundus (strain DSM 5631 / JCM 9629 / NBRC 100127 / Av18) TaxID=572546 RepID=D2RGA0_ARCPA|nr:hypothetical protein Arcpr_0255 [Archaeoglobus profundus DSM 5631]
MNATNLSLHDLNLSLVSLHTQFIGLAFIILTFVILFYAQALSRERKAENFVDWVRNYALVWIGLSVPIIFCDNCFYFIIFVGIYMRFLQSR